MYIHLDLEESDIGNIIKTMSSELGLERYRKEEAEAQLKAAREKIAGYEEKTRHQDDVEGLRCVIDDLINESKEKDAKITSLTNENTALEQTIRGMTERIEKLLASIGPSEADDANINYTRFTNSIAYLSQGDVNSRRAANINEPQ